MTSQTNFKLSNLNKEGPEGAVVSADATHVTFLSVKPLVIQPSEIQRVQIGVACETPPGCVLHISTCPKLAAQAAEVFPALIVVDHTHSGELIIPVRNNGRNPFNLMPGTSIAKGHLVKVETLNVEGFEYVAPKPEPQQSRPQKKNPFSFEVK